MEVLDARPIFRAGGGVKCRSRGRKKVVPKPSGKVSCRESALLATKLTYEKTYLVSRDDCSGRSGLVHDGGNPTDRNHHDPYRDRGGTHAHQHEHDCHPAKRGRLLSRRSEIRYERRRPLASPFFVSRPIAPPCARSATKCLPGARLLALRPAFPLLPLSLD
jgi:hypothetical protein